MERLSIEEAAGPPVDETSFEIVERKGLGHPDSMCDAVMDRISRELSAHYRERFGRVLHHNCDKGVLLAGRAEHRFGGGRVLAPMKLVLGGQATSWMDGTPVAIDEIAVEAARSWLSEHLPAIDLRAHIRFQVELSPGSEQLTGIFRGSDGVLGANDTSAAFGYAPLSETEALTLRAERFVQQAAGWGQDVKVMAVRRSRRIDMTVAVPLVDRHARDEASYFAQKEQLARALAEHLRAHRERIDDIAVTLNALDRRGAGAAGAYLTVLGTSAESGDAGAVGRGNAVNGLITPCRPRGAEAAAGKNPVSHVGKIYSVLAHRLAHRLHADVGGLREVMVWLVSRIGEPIDRPALIGLRVRPTAGNALVDLTPALTEVVSAELERVCALTDELARGLHPIC